MDIRAMIGEMGLVGMCVMGFLLALSIYSIAVILDKYRRFRSAASQSHAFVPELGRLLAEGELQQAAAAAGADRFEQSHVALVVKAGFDELRSTGGTATLPEARVELVSRALERSTARTLTDMKRGLGGLATIGSTAPFIGLFGTVIGIIHAFDGIAETGSGGIAAVSSGIAEALVATALGILVAIPAVMAFNHFTGMLERFHVELQTTSAELVDFLGKRVRTAS